MKRKLVIMAISLVFFLGGFFIINSRSQVIQTLSNSNSTIKANREFHEDMDYEIIDSHLSLVKKYENIEDLKKDSDIIIEGVVKSTTYRMIGEIPYTISQVEPKEIFKNDGNLEVGQTICIIEAGGFFEPKALLEEYKKKFPDENILLKDIKPTKLITDGISPMESGETVMIFGWRTPELDGNTCYGPVGEYQGKYLLEDSQWIQQIPQELKSGYKDYKKPNDEMIQILNSK